MEQDQAIALILLRALTKEEIGTLTQNTEAKSYCLYSEDPEYVTPFPQNYSRQPLQLKTIYESSYEESFQHILDASDLDINGQPLARLLSTENAYWWFYIRFMLLYKHRAAIYALKLLRYFQENIEAPEVHIYHNSGILHQLCELPYHSHYQAARKAAPQPKKIAKYVFSFAWRAIMGLFQIHHLFKSYPYLFLSNAQANQPVIRSKDLAIVGGDHFTEYLQEQLADEADFLNLSESFPPKLDGERSFTLSRQLLFARYPRTLNLELVLLLQLFNPRVWLRARRQIKALKASMAQLQAAELPIEQALIIRYIPSYKRLLFFLIFRREALKSFGLLRRARAVGGTNEHDARVKSLFDVARQLGVKTFGIQHGVVHPRHMQYIFGAKDLAYQPHPDLTFLWGAYWAKTLMQDSAYPESALQSLGQLRTDIIPQLQQLQKTDLLPELRNDRPVVLYPSQPLYEGEQEMRKRLGRDIMRLTLDFPDLQFIIKPHPWENDYRPFFEQLAAELGTKNFLFANTDLYKTLAISDIVIVYNSTVGGEAAYFGKPLIVMDYANNDFSGFIRSGIGLGTHQYEEVRQTLSKLLNGQLEAPLEQQQAFVHNRAHRIDGQTARRYIKAIRKL
ncbi:MAG: hypothetical protein AAGG75_04350 [Bacteroidota bacterium]